MRHTAEIFKRAVSLGRHRWAGHQAGRSGGCCLAERRSAAPAPQPAARLALQKGLLSEQLTLTYDAEDKAGAVSDRDGAPGDTSGPGTQRSRVTASTMSRLFHPCHPISRYRRQAARSAVSTRRLTTAPDAQKALSLRGKGLDLRKPVADLNESRCKTKTAEQA